MALRMAEIQALAERPLLPDSSVQPGGPQAAPNLPERIPSKSDAQGFVLVPTGWMD